MNNNLDAPALVCKEVGVRFPLVSASNAWRLLFGNRIEAWHEALSNVTLSVPNGKIVGVIGRNGAGKSTLLRTLAGVHPLFHGRVVRLGPISALFELGGMGGLLITGKQYIKRWLRLNGVPSAHWMGLIEEIREFSELGNRLDNRIYTYSAGMAARLYFSTATSVGHEIYLIDEVLSVGDEHFQDKCWKRIRERLANGVSGVLVTHDWSAVLRLCEHAYELENGRVLTEGSSDQVIRSYLQLAGQLESNQPARFSDECPTLFRATSGEDWVCNIPINIMNPEAVFFTYSIEKLTPGQDWQILILGSRILISTSVGKYFARITVPKLPLTSGEYLLNLFLSSDKPEDGSPRRSFDNRSWTMGGNSLKLYVEGEQKSSLVSLPIITQYS